MFHYEKPWQDVRDRVARAARDAGRPAESVELLAVSKSHPPEAIRALYGLGQRAFGENYVQEAVAKMEALSDLQGDRMASDRPIAEQQDRDGVPALRLGAYRRPAAHCRSAIGAARPPDAPPLNVCVQVNISGETTKSGVPPEDALALARAVAALPRLKLRGLMGIAEPTPVMGSRRGQFRVLRALFDACRAAGLPMDTLSMGMSDDLEAAVAEGATLVRIGTALFGPRAP